MQTIRNHRSAPCGCRVVWCVNDLGSVFAYEGTGGVGALVLAKAVTGVPDLR
jgi:hypothetical protein